MVIAVTFYFRETRGSVLLSRKAHALNRWYEAREQAGIFSFNHGDGTNERIRWKVKSDEERESLRKILKTSLTRPFCKYALLLQPRHMCHSELPSPTEVDGLTNIRCLRSPRH